MTNLGVICVVRNVLSDEASRAVNAGLHIRTAVRKTGEGSNVRARYPPVKRPPAVHRGRSIGYLYGPGFEPVAYSNIRPGDDWGNGAISQPCPSKTNSDREASYDAADEKGHSSTGDEISPTSSLRRSYAQSSHPQPASPGRRISFGDTSNSFDTFFENQSTSI